MGWVKGMLWSFGAGDFGAGCGREEPSIHVGKEHSRQRNPGAKALGQENVSMLREQTAGAGDVVRSWSTGDAGFSSVRQQLLSLTSLLFPPLLPNRSFSQLVQLCVLMVLRVNEPFLI